MNDPRITYGHVQVIDNVLPPELYAGLVQGSRRIGWNFGWNTPSNPNTRYWHHEVGQGRKSNTEDVSENVRKHPFKLFSMYQDWLKTHLVPPETRVLRYYLNAHTYGTDGWPHTDTDRGEELTCVLYLTPEWKPEWCGETVVFRHSGDIEAAVLPRSNRLMSFPSDRVHAPRPLSKAFEGLRVVLVVKLGAPDGKGEFFSKPAFERASQAEAMHLAYLRQAQAGATDHSGRTLLDHLWSTYSLLKLRGLDPEVCVAGLYHSVYGTAVYPNQLSVGREALRERIGERAERLAWLFSSLQRPDCWTVEGPSLPLVGGGQVELSAQDRRDLLDIERANLDEQGILNAERRQGIG